MKILAIHGSPRLGGNTDHLLTFLLEGVKASQGEFERINLYELKFSPCIECGECDHLGECILQDDMQFLYQKYLEADLLVVATPIFFYSHTSMVQAFFERFQAFWARKYRLGLPHPQGKNPRGILLSLGATKGKKIFEGVIRTFKYVMDAGWGAYVGGLFFREIDKKGEILKYPEILDKARELGKELILLPEDKWSLDRNPTP
ncbi:NADPH-dependent FMN reductase [Caldimicrobium thiodismutans]|jgi:multimeric flavodoxin WrbA|uniref:NADPH-dependent FMN reductase n=1 Tax=Caldimicrobium thiodismutans TaxID=1653476 RepID=A0A0U4W3N8_9BACT|nr:flavodoxin family protein [Caldimicrobium thiodismutans]BAU23707.1 NADPH-dependent FMN reductase [Caldimicrobium thiodismutans]